MRTVRLAHLALGILLYIALMQGARAQVATEQQTVHSSRSYRSLGTSWSSGVHSFSSRLFRPGKTFGYNALDVRYAWQSTEAHPWAGGVGYPPYGIGAYVGFLGDEQRFGKPIALYSFYTKDLFSVGGGSRIETSLSLGAAADLARYTDYDSSPLAHSMGSRITVFFDLRLGAALRLTRELDLTTGLYFTHMSNGRSFIPNLGINASGLYLGTRYYYSTSAMEEQPAPARYLAPYSLLPRPPLKKRHSISLYAAGATVQHYVQRGANGARDKHRSYPLSLILDYDYRLTGTHSLSLGGDYFRDPSAASQAPESASIHSGAIHLGYRYKVWRLSLGLQCGTYITNNQGKDTLFVRPSIRYDITPALFAQVGLKTRNGATADWIEWGLGLNILSL